ncbi:putative hydroxypyruvate isomerase [Dictyocaulus viviparus]|uniref:Putative hydroxypyruvate isomerase n=1 Tax=Dictyocaulus viviparus TaxID=29172 RepID=A0A0D8XPZ4_DICVI|nr:putative hydroxypyruvate isomerase [Dictyocaulus viviparus]
MATRAVEIFEMSSVLVAFAKLQGAIGVTFSLRVRVKVIGMRVAVNLNMFHPELPLLQRLVVAADSGFRQVEVSLPYSEQAATLKNTADSLGLTHTLINAPPGDWSRGFRGLAALPAFKDEFRDSIKTAIYYAKILKCDKVHVMAGIPGKNEAGVGELFLDNITYAATKMKEEGILCLIEPINHYTVPGYFLSSYEQAKRVIDEIKLPNLKIQYDLFHAQQICGQLSATINKYKDFIGYVQVAQVPSRDEPCMPGEIDYNFIFQLLQSTNSDWVVGLEHNFHESHGAPRDWVSKFGLDM